MRRMALKVVSMRTAMKSRAQVARARQDGGDTRGDTRDSDSCASRLTMVHGLANPEFYRPNLKSAVRVLITVPSRSPLSSRCSPLHRCSIPLSTEKLLTSTKKHQFMCRTIMTMSKRIMAVLMCISLARHKCHRFPSMSAI